MPPRGTICCRGTFATERRFPRSNKQNLLSVAKVPRQQIVPRGGILLASLREKITPTPNKTAKEAKTRWLLSQTVVNCEKVDSTWVGRLTVPVGLKVKVCETQK
ncbi:hypothetical protein Bbelb_180390 [Branchiostoma belcheri]|nr:hypothetical protein Bbelb_180390 [Branchiostoma belcheri]